MSNVPVFRVVLKRGALVAAANWQVVVVQFVGESTFKVLLAVPLVGGALLVALALGRDLGELLSGDLREILAVIATALTAQPIALVAFLSAFVIVLLGGSTLMFLVKGGTVNVLVAGDRAAGAIEKPPLRLATFRSASQFSIDTFLDGAARLFRRYWVLGVALLGAYTISGAAYVLAVVEGYRLVGDTPLVLGWTLVAVVCSGVLLVWITLVNLFYLLIQMVIAADEVGLRAAVRRVARFLCQSGREVAVVFVIVLVFAVLATAASILTTAGLGLIAFVPLAGLAVFPLQAAAWLLRGLVFQYLGLTALAAYLALYRASVRSAEL